jgi:membrane protein implicated in regulation of membrane protease activity
VGFAASSLAVLGFLLVSALVAGRIVSSSITALIVGCVATVALLLLSLSATVLSILVIDLARNMRLLIQRTDRSPAQVHNTKNQSRASLSQPAG